MFQLVPIHIAFIKEGSFESRSSNDVDHTACKGFFDLSGHYRFLFDPES